MTALPPRRSQGSAAQKPWLRAVVGVVLPWLVLFIFLRPLVLGDWPPWEWSGSLTRWASIGAVDVGLFLPVLLFAAGSALVRVVGFSRRLARVAAIVAIVAAAVSYVSPAVVGPVLTYHRVAERFPDVEERRPFGPSTPAGLVRNLHYVQENPPTEFSLSSSQLRNRPPEVLRFQLHTWIASAVFAIINVFLGVLVAEATAGVARPYQWNMRLAIGVIGGVLFLVPMYMESPIQQFLRGEPMGSGIWRAWRPLAVPVAQALLLGYWVWRRRR